MFCSQLTNTNVNYPSVVCSIVAYDQHNRLKWQRETIRIAVDGTAENRYTGMYHPDLQHHHPSYFFVWFHQTFLNKLGGWFHSSDCFNSCCRRKTYADWTSSGNGLHERHESGIGPNDCVCKKWIVYCVHYLYVCACSAEYCPLHLVDNNPQKLSQF